MAESFMPHVFCLREPWLIALHAAADGLIALSYLVIPFALLSIIRRRTDLAFRTIYILFGIFILSCGATHVLAVVTLWDPVYRLEGAVKALTAIASLGTAVLLIRSVPAAISTPGPEVLHKEIKAHRATIQSSSERLERAKLRLGEMAESLDKTQVLVRDIDGTILFWSRGAQVLYGWSKDAALGRKSHDLLHTEFPEPIEEIERELQERGSWIGELKHRRRDGAVVWVATHWSLQKREGETPTVIEVNNDITAIKRAEAARRGSEATTQSLFENASQGILIVDKSGEIVNANLMLKSMFGYKRGELIGRNVDILLPSGLRERHAGHRDNYAREPRTRLMGQGLDLVGCRKDGSLFPVEISLSHIETPERGLVMAFISDITARREASQEREGLITKLELALSEKTVLVKEVHHRVKNNLAVIAGLLEMQADAIEDEAASNALAESQRRVLSMAMIHERLYATENLDRLNFAEYASELANSLCSSFAVDETRISVVVYAEPIDVAIQTAIPCALILNELLTNTIKYAFPGGRQGEIRIGFERRGSGHLALSCQDNGVGIPEGFDVKTARSLGLKIVQILTRQIDGELHLDRSGPGTRFDLTFPEAA